MDGVSITNHHVMKNYNRPGTFSESNLKVTPEAMGFTGIKGLCRHSPVWAISSKACGQGLYHFVTTLGFFLKKNLLITTGYHKKKTKKDVEHFKKFNAHPLWMKSYNEKCALQPYNKVILMSLQNSDLQEVELGLCGN